MPRGDGPAPASPVVGIGATRGPFPTETPSSVTLRRPPAGFPRQLKRPIPGEHIRSPGFSMPGGELLHSSCAVLQYRFFFLLLFDSAVSFFSSTDYVSIGFSLMDIAVSLFRYYRNIQYRNPLVLS